MQQRVHANGKTNLERGEIFQGKRSKVGVRFGPARGKINEREQQSHRTGPEKARTKNLRPKLSGKKKERD